MTERTTKRHFKLVKPLIKYRIVNGVVEKQKDSYGNFNNKNPCDAAQKAINDICISLELEKKLKTCKGVIFELKEVTRGSKQKTYKYIGIRRKLENPKKIRNKKTNQIRTYKYESIAHAYYGKYKDAYNKK